MSIVTGTEACTELKFHGKQPPSQKTVGEVATLLEYVYAISMANSCVPAEVQKYLKDSPDPTILGRAGWVILNVSNLPEFKDEQFQAHPDDMVMPSVRVSRDEEITITVEADDHFRPDVFSHLLHETLKAVAGEGPLLSTWFEWSYVASGLENGMFGGGAAVVTSKEVRYLTTSNWAIDQISKLQA